MKKQAKKSAVQSVLKYIKIILLVLIILFSINMALLIILSMAVQYKP